MPTPKFDKICIEFLKRIPDQFTDPTFLPGDGDLPDGYLLKADKIIDYVNRGLQRFFNTMWQKVEGNVQAFINLMPEMQRVTEAVALTGGAYEVATPYLDFFRIIGGLTHDPNNEEVRTYIKPKAESLYMHFLSGKYKSYQATASDPAIIQVENKLAVFPSNVSTHIIVHYIKLPLDPETGFVLTQNGDYDSPFTEQWHKEISDIAYTIWLEETVQTTQ